MVVTPGMVELGPQQAVGNAEFARSVAEHADDLVIVRRTNKTALLQGVAQAQREGATLRVRTVRDREEAVAIVRANRDRH